VSLTTHFPALLVVVPLLSAPICVLLGRGNAAWLLATVVAWFTLIAAATLLWQVHDGSVISYHLGGWAPPWGIEYRVDALNAFVLLIVAGTATVVMPYARRSGAHEIAADRLHLFYCMMLLCLAGLLGMAVTGDAFNVFVFLEISSLATYTLVALGRHRKALMSAFQYLVMGTIGATFFIIGVGLMYMMTGTLNMADLAARLPAISHTRPIEAAYAFIVVGLALKLALFPLHLWLPNAYTYAPNAVSAFLAATATKVAIYLLIRFTFTIFGADFAFGSEPFALLLFVPALMAVFAGAIVAAFQDDGKRLLAYSSVSQVGYIVLAISLASTDALAAALVHVFNHALMKGALFLALGCVFFRLGSTRLDRMAGLGREMPWTMAAIVVGGLSLIGVPLTAGFVSKWLLLKAAFGLGLWWLAALIVLSSLIAIVYIWRIVEHAYFRAAPEGRERIAEAPLSLLLPTWTLAAANLYFGIHNALPVGVAGVAARALVGGAP
jgi:multicomponent Na+:H+ antiporter subunit D